jgi:glycosyltransferase involved in cell wall biosynthesis
MNNSADIPKTTGTGVDVSVVVPAFNEEGNLPLLAEKFAAMFAKADFSGEVILVDDGSTDNTHAAALECRQRYPFWKVERHRVNRGLTAALETGFAAARGRIFVFYPADLQYLPEDIPKMIQRINEGYDVVTGWKQGSYGVRRFVSAVYNGVSRTLFPVGVHDLNSVKAFRREVVENLTFRRDWHRYMVVMAAYAGYRVGEVKVQLHPRHSGQSKFSGVSRILIGVLDLVAVKFQLSFMKKPLLFFGSLGLIMLAMAAVVGGVAIYLRLILQEGYRPLLTLVMLLATSGIMFFAMGFLGELLINLKEDISSLKRRLHAVEGRTRQTHGHPSPTRNAPRHRPPQRNPRRRPPRPSNTKP